MKNIIISFFLSISFLYANIIDIQIEDKYEKYQDYIFTEPMNDANTSGNNYEKLDKRKNNINFSLDANFKDLIGINYIKSISGVNYENKELYLGSSSMKYLSLSKTNEDIDYGTRNTKKDISKITFLNIFNIGTENFSSATTEVLKADKLAAIPTATSPIKVHRNYTKEVFVASSENLYNIANKDAENGKEYFSYGLFVKKVTPNITLYGVPIIGFVQYNYTKIENYFVDSNGTRRNLAYSTKVEDDNVALNTSASDLKNKPNFNLLGRYRGYEVGFKVTALYKLKNYNLFLTAYQKNTVLDNKQKKDTSQTNLSSPNNNALEYRKLKFTQNYLSFGLKYNF